MASFNKFPTKVDDDSASVTETPTLRGEALPTFFGGNLPNSAPGYASSVGSTILLPITDTATVSAVDVTGSTLWSFTIASFSAAITGQITSWVGFHMNVAGTALESKALDNATTNDTFYTFSINVSGTITETGNSQPTTDFVIEPQWSDFGTMQPDGSGGFKIFSGGSTVANSQFAVINSAGAFTTQPTLVFTNANAAAGVGMYETTGGKILGPLGSSPTTDNTTINVSNKTDTAVVVLPYNAVKAIDGQGNGFFFLRWQDFIITWDTSAAEQQEGRFKYTEGQVDTFADDLLAYGGTPA